MAVYTTVGVADVQALFERLGLGDVVQLRPVAAGIENTNYFVDAASGPWVLTLFERLSAEQLPFYLGLMQHLARQGLPVPEPRGMPGGGLVHALAGKPCAVVPRLPGEHHETPGIGQIRDLGALLARMHLAGQSAPLTQAHLRGLDWWRETAPVVMPYLTGDTARLLKEELAFIEHAATTPAWQALPRGPVHADLFRDNVLFVDTPAGPQLSGVLDFYFAGVESWLFDIAVCLNDWCVDAPSGRLVLEQAEALVGAYQQVRPFTAGEWRLLPTLLRAAALRFWLSRLWDWHLPRAAAVLTPKDPVPYEHILRERISAPWHPETL